MSKQMRREIIVGPGQEVLVRAAGQPTGETRSQEWQRLQAELEEIQAERARLMRQFRGRDPLSEVLDAIVAEGHVDVRIDRSAGMPDDMRWRCESALRVTRWTGNDAEAYREWQFVNHEGEKYATTPVEAAQARLDQIRLGKSLTWLAFAAPEPS